MRTLIEAAVYRRFRFDSEEAYQEYLDGGIMERWAVSKKKDGDSIIAVIGERYNNAKRLEMVEK